MRETDLDLASLFTAGADTVQIKLPVGMSQSLGISCDAAMSRLGSLVLPVEKTTLPYVERAARRGNVVTFRGSDYLITSVEPRYLDSDLKYYVCEVRKIHA